MQIILVTAERQNSGCPAITIEYEIAEDLNELLSQYGETIVYAHARRSIVNALQSFVRTAIDKGVENEDSYDTIVRDVQEALKTWQPSRRRIAKTAKEKAEQILSKLSPGERVAVLREYEAVLRREQEAAE